MGLKGLIIALMFVFATAVYVLIIGPIMGPLYSLTTTDAVAAQGMMEQMTMVRDLALIWVPTMLVIGIVIYAWAATQKRESFFGSFGTGGPR